jgi:flagellar hook-basal body complex protein FliE
MKMKLESAISKIKLDQVIGGKQTGKSDRTSLPFADVLRDSIQKANRIQMETDQAITDLATGKGMDIAKTMIAFEKANISFQMMTQVRNKIIEAYQEIMRMQV